MSRTMPFPTRFYVSLENNSLFIKSSRYGVFLFDWPNRRSKRHFCLKNRQNSWLTLFANVFLGCLHYFLTVCYQRRCVTDNNEKKKKKRRMDSEWNTIHSIDFDCIIFFYSYLFSFLFFLPFLLSFLFSILPLSPIWKQRWWRASVDANEEPSK